MSISFSTDKNILDMTPIEFEKFCVDFLKNETKNLEGIDIKHDETITTDDGDYQIDGTMTYEIASLEYKTLIECKHYKHPISREKVQILYDKIRATGYNKGILISTSTFQQGALQFAKKHGIALIQIVEKSAIYHTRMLNSSHTEFDNQYCFLMQEYKSKNSITNKRND